MPEYNKDEWQRMIEQYQNELMAQYAAAPKAQNDTLAPIQEETVQTESEPIAETNSTAEEANEETVPTPTEKLTDIGRLQVRVSTENQAVPIPGAVITITRETNNSPELIRTVIADDSGLTPLMDLATKDRRLSLVPGNQQPYAVYTVDVTADGYYPKRFIGLPIYGGVTAVQSVSMIPLPESGGDDMVLSFPQSGPVGL